MFKLDGFRECDTGGGCKALRRDFDGFYLLATAPGDASLPDSFPIDVGAYNASEDTVGGNEPITYWHVRDLRGFANVLRNAQGCTDERCSVAAEEGTDGECWACRIGGCPTSTKNEMERARESFFAENPEMRGRI